MSKTYASARPFLDDLDETRSGCVVTDLRLPEMSGLELQRHLADRDSLLPCVLISGHGDIPSAVEALRAGAVDFIPKPFRPQQLLDAVHAALRRNATLRLRRAERDSARARFLPLSNREREVLALLVAGQPNKNIAARLGISSNTVENRRANIMKKTGVGHIAELVRLVVTAEFDDRSPEPDSE